MNEPLDIVAYRDFYDVPRAFIVLFRGEALLFDSPFDAECDEYSEYFQVFQGLRCSVAELPRDWTNIRSLFQKHLGRVPVGRVLFDPSRRAQIDATVADLIEPPSP